MGEKDIIEKALADYNDVFADIMNVLAFNGKDIIEAKGLANSRDISRYKVDGKMHELERDVTKLYSRNEVRLALVGVEHQTQVDKDEPFRVIGYDGAAYRSQLLKNSRERYPVVTIVLYFGLSRWNGSKSLYEALDIDEEWKPFVNDYKINLFEIAYLEPEQVQMFKSDFRIVADYFVQMRMNKAYIPSKETIKHVDELFKLMAVLTGDTRFEERQNMDCGKEVTTVCELFDIYENRGIEKGKIEGKIELLLEMGYGMEEMSQMIGISVEEVERIVEEMKV